MTCLEFIGRVRFMISTKSEMNVVNLTTYTVKPAQSFDCLLSKLEQRLTKVITDFKESISAEQRLVITLRSQSKIDTQKTHNDSSMFKKLLVIKLTRHKEGEGTRQDQTTTSLPQDSVIDELQNKAEETTDAQEKAKEEETKNTVDKTELKNTGDNAEESSKNKDGSEKMSTGKSSKNKGSSEKMSTGKSSKNVSKSFETIPSKSQLKTDSKKSGSSGRESVERTSKGNVKSQSSSSADNAKELIQNILGIPQAERSGTNSKFKIPHKTLSKQVSEADKKMSADQERKEQTGKETSRTPDRSKKEKSVERMLSQASRGTGGNDKNRKETPTKDPGKGVVESKPSPQSTKTTNFPIKNKTEGNSQHTTQKLDAETADPNQKLVREFYCHKCGLRFEDFGKLHEHIFKSTNDKHIFRCESCEYIVGKTLTNVISHITRYCPREKFNLCEEKKLKENPKLISYFCERCGKSTGSLSNLYSHYNQHLDENLCCSLCDKQFRDFSEILLHYRDHLVVGNLYLACKFCPLEFYATEPYILHNFTVHSHILNIPFECDLCVKVFFDEEEKFLFHVQSHCQINSKSDRPNTDVSKLTCEVCAEIFDSIYDCIRHKEEIHRSEIGAKRSCPKCKRDVAVSTMSNHLLFHRLELAAKLPKNERKTSVKSDKELKLLCPPRENSPLYPIETVDLSQVRRANQETVRKRVNTIKVIGPHNAGSFVTSSQQYSSYMDMTQHTSSMEGMPQQEILPRPHTETTGNITLPQLNQDLMRESIVKKPAMYVGANRLISSSSVDDNESFRAQSNINSNRSGHQSFFSPSSILSKQAECEKCGRTFLTLLALKEHMKSHLLENPPANASSYVLQTSITEPKSAIAAVKPFVDKSSFPELRATAGVPQLLSQQYIPPRAQSNFPAATSSTNQNPWESNFMGQTKINTKQPHDYIYSQQQSFRTKLQSSFVEWSSHDDENDLYEGTGKNERSVDQLTGTVQSTSHISSHQSHFEDIPESYSKGEHEEYVPRGMRALSPTVGHSGYIQGEHEGRQYVPRGLRDLSPTGGQSDYIQGEHKDEEYVPRGMRALSPTVGQSDYYSQTLKYKSAYGSGASGAFPEWSSYDDHSNLDTRDPDDGPRSSETPYNKPSHSQRAYVDVEDETPIREDPRSYRNWDTEQTEYMRRTNSQFSELDQEYGLSSEMEESYLDTYNRQGDSRPAMSTGEEYGRSLRRSPEASQRRRSRSIEFEERRLNEREYRDTTYSATSRSRRSSPPRVQRKRSPSPSRRERYRSRSPYGIERSRSPPFSRRRKSPVDSRRRKSPVDSRRRYTDDDSRY